MKKNNAKKITFSNKGKSNTIKISLPKFIPMAQKQMDFENLLSILEKKFSRCVTHIRQIYEDRFGLIGKPVELGTTEEKLSLINEFLIKFGFSTLSPEDADIAYHEGGDEAFFLKNLVPVFSGLEKDLW
jgi:hypothetical protein